MIILDVGDDNSRDDNSRDDNSRDKGNKAMKNKREFSLPREKVVQSERMCMILLSLTTSFQ